MKIKCLKYLIMKKLAILIVALSFFSAKAQEEVTFSQSEIDQIINNKIWCITSLQIRDEIDRDGKWFILSDCNIIFGEDERIYDVDGVLSKIYLTNGIRVSVENGITMDVIILPEYRHPMTKENIDLGWGIDNSYTYVKCRIIIKEDGRPPMFGILQSTNSLYGLTNVAKFPPPSWDGTIPEE